MWRIEGGHPVWREGAASWRLWLYDGDEVSADDPHWATIEAAERGLAEALVALETPDEDQ